jgi:hypothetical protein
LHKTVEQFHLLILNEKATPLDVAFVSNTVTHRDNRATGGEWTDGEIG